MIGIDRACADANLLGAALGDVAPWQTWMTILRAAFALPLDDAQRDTFATVAGGRSPPPHAVSELWAIAGRRSGKSRMAAAIGCYLACFMPRRLAPGELGEVTIIAASRDQARVVFGYIVGFLQASPVLRQEIEAVTAHEVRLHGGVVLTTRAGSFRTVRGRTLLAAILDEVAFFRDDTSATPDIETYRAVLPALATTKGMLIGISTPYRRLGLLYTKHRDYYGLEHPHVLVVSGATEQFNPTLDASIIDRSRESDPEAARAEWDAEFRSDIGAFLDEALIDQAVDHDRPLDIPPRSNITYTAFVDAASGVQGGDHYTLAIGHTEGDDLCVIDVVYGRAPPFDPQDATKLLAITAKQYGITEVCGDFYSAGWVESAWTAAGITYIKSERAKSQLYIEALPTFTRGLARIPDHQRLLRELRLLERRTSRQGKDQVDHGPRGHDDYANAACACLAFLSQRGTYDASAKWMSGPWHESNLLAQSAADEQWRTDQYFMRVLGASNFHNNRRI